MTQAYRDNGVVFVALDDGSFLTVRRNGDTGTALVLPATAGELVTEDEIDSTEAYENGYEDGQSSGYDDGYSDGVSEAEGNISDELEDEYQRGYDEGYAAAEEELA